MFPKETGEFPQVRNVGALETIVTTSASIAVEWGSSKYSIVVETKKMTGSGSIEHNGEKTITLKSFGLVSKNIFSTDGIGTKKSTEFNETQHDKKLTILKNNFNAVCEAVETGNINELLSILNQR